MNDVSTTFTMDLNSSLTQALSDGTYSYLYGVGRFAQSNSTTTEYFLSDALGSARQLADATGVVTLTKSYDPYGVVNASSGMSASSFGFTNEYQDSYTKLIYLRSRMYGSLTGRFLSRDTWEGDYNRPLSLNHWSFVAGNPINYTDPSVLCPSCYIFYFPGVGNPGDPTGNNNPFAYLSSGEQQLINDLKIRTNSNVEEIYPYGSNGADWIPNLGSTSFGQSIAKFMNLPVIFSKAWPTEVINTINCGVSNQNAKVTFIGYSGGSQVAYNTAQQLAGKIFINNFVAFGPIYEAYKQLNNIGHIWELVGKNDIYAEGLAPFYGYNSGYRYHNIGGESMPFKHNDLDIYQHGAVRCTLFGTSEVPYQHADTGSYTDISTYDNGMDCGSGKFSPSSGYYGQETRVDAIIDFLIYIVHAGDQ